jgi:hypothetical protein
LRAARLSPDQLCPRCEHDTALSDGFGVSPPLIGGACGFAKVAGAELTLLDCVRYFHRASCLSGVAQIVKDRGEAQSPQTCKSRLRM